jgi:hypothetical protein
MAHQNREWTQHAGEEGWLVAEIVDWVTTEDEVKKLRRTASWIRATDPDEAGELEARATAAESLASQKRDRILAQLGRQGPDITARPDRTLRADADTDGKPQSLG